MAKTNIQVKLTGTDGNVFALAAQVINALRRNQQGALVEEFKEALFKCKSYDDALVLMQDYVEVV